jgi:hypothetical protein
MKSFASSCLQAHIAAWNDDVYGPFLPCSNCVMDFGGDGEGAFDFDCCSALAGVRHVLPYERLSVFL